MFVVGAMLIAFVALIALVNPAAVYRETGTLPQLTWVTPLIILFPLIAPVTPRRMLLTSLAGLFLDPGGNAGDSSYQTRLETNLGRWTRRRLRRIADEFSTALQAIPRTSEVNVVGGRPRTLRILIDPESLAEAFRKELKALLQYRWRSGHLRRRTGLRSLAVNNPGVTIPLTGMNKEDDPEGD